MTDTHIARTFTLPSAVETPPGAEGWEQMYPYFTRFRPEDDQRFWFYNAMHFPEPMPAFDAITAEISYAAIGANTARLFVFPTTLGIEYRIVNGRVYITANPVFDPEEIQRRAVEFEQRAGYYYENWVEVYDGWQGRIEQLIREIEAIEVPQLPEFDDFEAIKAGRGYAENHLVVQNYNKCLDLFSRMWHYHTEMLMLGYGAYVVFFDYCRSLFPDITDQALSRMVGGVDVTMYRPDEELKKLARRAVELGVDDLFVEGCTAEQVLGGMRERGQGGAAWIADFEAAHDPWFNVSSGDGFYHHHLSWADDLTLPFSALPRYVAMVKAGDSLERPTELLKQERERIAQEYRAMISSEDERAAYDQMLELCRTVFPFVEDHKFYCEHWFATRFFQKIRAYGQLLVRRGVLADADDIFHLQRTEAIQALLDVELAWSSGGVEMGARHWQPIVEERKRIVGALSRWQAPPALGPMPEGLNDPAVHMLWGVTAETIQTWADASTDSDEVHGYAASPGVVEGAARVLLSVTEIGELCDGEILVCPVTAPSWGPVFGKIKAAVSDIGGTMSHAAIVAREYGMPAVVGTGTATHTIRTGQWIRVDGDRGIVTILDRDGRAASGGEGS